MQLIYTHTRVQIIYGCIREKSKKIEIFRRFSNIEGVGPSQLQGILWVIHCFHMWKKFNRKSDVIPLMEYFHEMIGTHKNVISAEFGQSTHKVMLRYEPYVNIDFFLRFHFIVFIFWATASDRYLSILYRKSLKCKQNCLAK